MGELGPGGGSGCLKYESMEGMGDDVMEVDREMEGRSVEVDWRMNEAERTREDRDAEKVSGNSVERWIAALLVLSDSLRSWYRYRQLERTLTGDQARRECLGRSAVLSST